MVRNGPVVGRRRARWWWPFAGANGSNRRRAGVSAVPSEITRKSTVDVTRKTPVSRTGRDWLRVVGLAATVGALTGAIWGGRRWLTHSPHFAIREVRLMHVHHASVERLRARAAVELGDNLFRVDLRSVERELANDPWVARAHAYRELPATLVLDVEEHEPACVVALGPLYLADARGEVFKRATVEDTALDGAALPIVTGIARDGYVDDRDASQALVRDALAALSLWREDTRAPVGEVHVDAAVGLTLYTQDGVGARIGRGDSEVLRARLRRLDVAWRAVAGEHPRLFIVDQHTHPERVVVELAAR